jgi:hypothetical protein
MKLTRNTVPDLIALADCVAHRCTNHTKVPPLNWNEGNGSSECGVCAAEELAQQALDKVEELIILPLLNGYADRLTHHAVLRAALRIARDRLNLAAGGAGDFLDEHL